MEKPILNSLWLARLSAQLVLVMLLGACTDNSGVTIYPARHILTMEPGSESHSALAVQEGRIVGLGSQAGLQAEFANEAVRLDTTFADKTLMPGFIDPHIHPSIAAVILPLDIVSAMEWATPSGTTIAVKTEAHFRARLGSLLREKEPDEVLFTWGYHELYHGPLNRKILDDISSTQPIVVWQRSVHELYFNTAALEMYGMSESDFAASEQANWQDGHLWETGLFAVGQSVFMELVSPLKYLKGLSMMSSTLHKGGLTTVGEQGGPQLNEYLEFFGMAIETWGGIPYRYVVVPNAMYYMKRLDSVVDVEEKAQSLVDSYKPFKVIKHIKLYVDGAMFSPAMKMSEAFIDGHHGEWMMTPEQQQSIFDVFWDKGWHFHLHVNGDAGLDQVLSMVEKKRETSPRDDVRIVLEHYGYAREEQHQRVKDLGIVVSNNAYYLHELAPIYASAQLGPERAADISPLGGLARAGVPFSFHSDYFMAPAEPLTQVWVAVNRIASDGKVWGEHQKVALDLALRAITTEAAYSLGMESEIGSIKLGKRADFTVLAENPYDVDPKLLKDIAIWGTVLDGTLHPL